jgi:phosphate transport system protein
MNHRHLDSGLSDLSSRLLTMAGYVEQALECATASWKTKSRPKIEEVFAIEERVNRTHIEVDAACVKLLALQQPMAADLRFIVSCIKINNDLERMVDLTVNIANHSNVFILETIPLQLGDLAQMSDEVRAMVREVLDAFVKNDENIARKILHRDDKVDAYKRKIVADCVVEMKKDSKGIDALLNVISISRNLERIGDHATNIAEDIIFSVSGLDVRHSSGGAVRTK